MKVINTIPLLNTNIFDCLTDGITVKMVGAGPHIDLITLDPESLGLVSRFPVDAVIHEFYSSCLDNSCVYIPTKLGQILAVDQFSGETLTTINLGMPVMSDLVQDDKNIYCVCGVPLGRKLEVLFNNFCVCICDKETGIKKVQTNYFIGNPTALTKCQNSLWVIGGQHLIQYSCDGEYIQKTYLGPHFEYTPIILEDHIICVSLEGLVKILDKNKLELSSLTRAQTCISKPFLVNEALVWVTSSGICHVNFKQKSFREIKTGQKMLSDAVLSNDKTQLFAINNTGNIMSFNLLDDSTQSIKLTQDILRMPIVAEDYLLVSSATQMHQLKVE